MNNFLKKNNIATLQVPHISLLAAARIVARKRRQFGKKKAANNRNDYTFRESMLLQDSQKCKHRASWLYTFTNLARELVPLEPRRNKAEPEKSVLFYCSRRLCFE